MLRCMPEADGSDAHRGLSYLLVPMHQEGIEIRPIVQLTGTSEFNEVFFNGARTDEVNVVGRPGEGWKVAMGTLAFERGLSTLSVQLGFEREMTAHAVETGAAPGRLHDAVLCATGSCGRGPACASCAGTRSGFGRSRGRHARTGGVGRQAVLGNMAPKCHEPGDRRGRSRTG